MSRDEIECVAVTLCVVADAAVGLAAVLDERERQLRIGVQAAFLGFAIGRVRGASNRRAEVCELLLAIVAVMAAMPSTARAEIVPGYKMLFEHVLLPCLTGSRAFSSV